jgi:hypothetical protein
MKKFIIMTAILIGLSVSAQANTNIMFQKTYEVPGMKADEIKTAFGSLKMTQADSKIDAFGKALKMIQFKPVDKSDKDHAIKCKWLASNHWYDADVILQARDGKYRITFSNVRDMQSGMTIDKAPKSLKKKCVEQVEQWADMKYEQVQSLAF